MKTAAPAPGRAPTPGEWPDPVWQDGQTGQPMPGAGEDPASGFFDEPPRSASRIAAQLLDLGSSRRLVYMGGDGDVLAAFLDEWPQLRGVWVGPAAAQAAACRFLAEQGLNDRVRYVAGQALDATLTGDLVLTNALDTAVETTLEWLVSAASGWLPAQGRWLILQRKSPHLSSVICAPLLQRQGLRLVTEWPLHQGVHMLVCAPEHRVLEMLESRADRAVPGSGSWSGQP